MNSIAFWRRIRGKSQVDIEAETGIDQAVLSEVENGQRSPDSYLEKLEKALLLPKALLLEPPPLTIGSDGDIIIDRTNEHVAPGVLVDSEGAGRKSRKLNIGRTFFLTPSQARVGIQRNRSIEISNGIWDGARVYVEVPCEPEHQKILLAKAYAASLADQFLREEQQRIEAEYAAIFKQGLEGEFAHGEEPGFPEDDGTDAEGLPRSPEAGDGET